MMWYCVSGGKCCHHMTWYRLTQHHQVKNWNNNNNMLERCINIVCLALTLKPIMRQEICNLKNNITFTGWKENVMTMHCQWQDIYLSAHLKSSLTTLLISSDLLTIEESSQIILECNKMAQELYTQETAMKSWEPVFNPKNKYTQFNMNKYDDL